jgi:hypothetical protein
MDNFISTETKVDLLFKKHFSKPYTHTVLPFFQEPPIFSRQFVLPEQIWANIIPTSVPNDLINATLDDLSNTLVNSTIGKTSIENSIIKKYEKVQLEFISGSQEIIAFKGPDYNNINILSKSIPFNYDQYSTTYEYKLYKDNGDQIYFSEGSWIVDNDAGIITFNTLLDGISEEHPPLITFYKYIGEIGLDIKANKTEVYSKIEINQQHNNLLDELDIKANITDIYNQDVLYTKNEIISILENYTTYKIIDKDENTFIKVDDDNLNNTDNIIFYTNNSHRISILNNGSIGINTENPSELLHIENGDILAKNSCVKINNVITNTKPLLSIESNYSNQTYNLVFLESNNVTDIRFKSYVNTNADWLVGLGKDQSIGGNQSFYIYNTENEQYYLTMEPNTTDPKINGYINVGSNNDCVDLDIRNGGIITSSIKPSRNSSSCLTITHSGDDNICKVGVGVEVPMYELHVNGTIYGQIITTPSDKRLKKNIKKLDNVLEKINRLQGVSFEWDSDQILCKQPQIGLIAQQVEDVFPEIVYTDKQGLKSMTYDKLTSVLIEAIKELNCKVNTLMDEKKEYNEKKNLKE